MVSEEKHKINVWCPERLWKQVEALGFDSPTKAVMASFEKLVTNSQDGSLKEQIRHENESKTQEMEKQLNEARKHALDIQNELSARLEEAHQQIEGLKKDKENLIEMYNKHVLQVQALLRDNKYIISRISVPIFNVIENYHK
jgi:DNA repair exonuclease SbcCD ATPase subunit